ncbi:PP2C family protein-serine/threonine phosphatase [Streptomyces sp. NBC_00876]|uniref:PP2C family protein-serine/threonine phosphatase n=1 Tax=Streptomyces sp. NBC_00876 TaxID=2975853 RepID=UPI0038636677
MPCALIAAVTVGDIVAPPDVHLGPFLVAAPAITASFAGPWLTSVVGVAAVVAQVAVAAARTTVTDLNHMSQIIALCLISAIATLFAHRRKRHTAEMVQLRSVAEAAQLGVLRPLPARSGPLRLATVYMAAQEGAQLGGDLYAAARTADGTRLIIGDVRGKGLDAISSAAGVLGAFRALARQEEGLPALVARLETSVAAHQIDSLQEEADENIAEGFVTAAVLDIPDAAPVLRLVSCGHPPPLILRGGQVYSLDVTEPVPPLGIGQLAVGHVAQDEFRFDAGDLLLLYTDGVTEARDGAGAFYPLADRVAALSGENPEALLRHLRADLLRHAGGHLGDDAALVAIERLPATG